MTRYDAPQSPAERRPNNEPYYIDPYCTQCESKLELADKDLPEEEIWHDEWKCYNEDCKVEAIFLDVPPDTLEELGIRMGNVDNVESSKVDYYEQDKSVIAQYMSGIAFGLIAGSLIMYEFRSIVFLLVIVVFSIILAVISGIVQDGE